MYGLNIPVSAIRTKIRQEFERHRYVNDLLVTDQLIFRSDMEYQVRTCVELSVVCFCWMNMREGGGA